MPVQDFKSVTQQPSLSLDRDVHRACHTGPRWGREVGRESLCLIINGFFYFCRCLRQWAEGTQ